MIDADGSTRDIRDTPELEEAIRVGIITGATSVRGNAAEDWITADKHPACRNLFVVPESSTWKIRPSTWAWGGLVLGVLSLPVPLTKCFSNDSCFDKMFLPSLLFARLMLMPLAGQLLGHIALRVEKSTGRASIGRVTALLLVSLFYGTIFWWGSSRDAERSRITDAAERAIEFNEELARDPTLAKRLLESETPDNLRSIQRHPNFAALSEATANRTVLARARFTAAQSEADFEGALTPAQLISDGGPGVALVAIGKGRTAVDNLEQELASVQETAELEISLLPIDKADQESLHRDFRAGVDGSAILTREWFTTQREMLNTLERFVRFVDEHSHGLEPGTNDQYIFSSKEEVDEYNEIVDAIDRLGQRDVQISEEIAEYQKAMLARYKGASSRN